MHEQIRRSVVGGDESVSLFGIEPFDGSGEFGGGGCRFGEEGALIMGDGENGG